MIVYLLGTDVCLFHPGDVFIDSFLKWRLCWCPTFYSTQSFLIPPPMCRAAQHHAAFSRPPLSFRGTFDAIFLPSKVQVLIKSNLSHEGQSSCGKSSNTMFPLWWEIRIHKRIPSGKVWKKRKKTTECRSSCASRFCLETLWHLKAAPHFKGIHMASFVCANTVTHPGGPSRPSQFGPL